MGRAPAEAWAFISLSNGATANLTAKHDTYGIGVPCMLSNSRRSWIAPSC